MRKYMTAGMLALMLVGAAVGLSPSQSARAEMSLCNAREAGYLCDQGGGSNGRLGGDDGRMAVPISYPDCWFENHCTGMDADTRLVGWCGRSPVYGCGAQRSCNCPLSGILDGVRWPKGF